MTPSVDALHEALRSLSVERPESAEDLALDRDLAAALAARLNDALEAAFDVANARLPLARTSFTEAIQALHDLHVLDDDLAAALIKLGQLRRASNDGYTGIDVERLHHAVTDGISTLEAFARVIRHS